MRETIEINKKKILLLEQLKSNLIECISLLDQINSLDNDTSETIPAGRESSEGK